MNRAIDNLVKKMLDVQASDLFISTNNFPAMRIDGDIQFVSSHVVGRNITHQIYEEMTGMTPDEGMMGRTELDMAYSCKGIGRFRVNIFHQNAELAYVFRHIPTQIPQLEDLGLPIEVLKRLAQHKRGLVLVTGMTGSGKSTTLAGMVEYINHNHHKHIVTIEDPVEFIYQRDKSLINQRELGRDTPDFKTAMKSAMRQSPDVILIGEMRDQETVATCLEAAETGHLVLSTLHTLNATQTVERILAFFPPHQHDLIRLQMSLILEGVISQRLIRRADGRGRIACVEILLATPTIKELLSAGDTRSLEKAVYEGAFFGCQTFNQALSEMVNDETITEEMALSYSDNPEQLKMELRGITQSAAMPSSQKPSGRHRAGGSPKKKEERSTSSQGFFDPSELSERKKSGQIRQPKSGGDVVFGD